jgi:hypothetical protein
MAIFLEIHCLNQHDSSFENCYSRVNRGVRGLAEDTQTDLVRVYKQLQDAAQVQGWRWAKKTDVKKSMLCPACAVFFELDPSRGLLVRKGEPAVLPKPGYRWRETVAGPNLRFWLQVRE